MTPPSTASFKAQFVRDFPFGTSLEAVMDADIENASKQAGFSVNESLFETESDFQFAYNYLTAHNLVMNIKNSSQGMSGSFSWLESSKGVGSVSQSFAIPSAISENPFYAMMAKTGYGAYYLSLVIPKTYGQVGMVGGATLE